MTDEQIDRMVRDADPYRPGVVGHLDGAKQTLLEEIMSEPRLDVVEPPRVPGRRLPGRLVGALAAAAVLIVVLIVSTLVRDPQRPDTFRAAGPSGAPIAFSPAALQAAEKNPRLLIDEPGWKATTVSGFAESEGAIGFTNGPRSLEMNWYAAGSYGDYYRDRLDVSKPERVTVDGMTGARFTYSDTDWAVMLKPRDGSFVELRTGAGWNRKDFDAILTRIVRVDVRTWLAALPPEIVTPDRADVAAGRILADVPLPPEFDREAALRGLGTNDPYQFGANVTGRVTCGWIAEWERAVRAGDEKAAQRAVDALLSSKKWKVLQDMNDEGYFPEVIWEYADQVAAGHAPEGYRSGLGCP